jgi:hypothetical protein
MKDYFKTSLLTIVRGKKKLVYSLVILILVIISSGLFVYRNNTERLIHYSLTKEIGYRSLVTEVRVQGNVWFEDNGVWTMDFAKIDKAIKKDIEDISKIKHVIDAFDNTYWETVVTSDFANDKVDGTVTLLRGTPESLPPIVAGRIFKDGENGVAICPRHFYPNFEPREVNKDSVIDGYTILNTDFNIEYHDYIVENRDLKIVNTYTKKFKIVGLYDTVERINDNGVCYISKDDITEINDIQRSYNKADSGIPGLNIIVDNIKNVEYVRGQLEKMGFENISVGAVINTEMVNTIRVSFISVFALILLTIIILIPIYAKWRIKREEKKIGLLRACGYSKKTVKYLYIIELFLLHIFIYIIGTTIFLIGYFIAIQKIQFLINASYMLGGLKIGITSLIFTFLLTVILPCLITAFHVNKKCNQDIINLIGEQE